MHARTHTTCTHTFTHTCMHTHRHAHMHACTHSCSTHMRIHTHTHTHTHARMHTHTHTQPAGEGELHSASCWQKLQHPSIFGAQEFCPSCPWIHGDASDWGWSSTWDQCTVSYSRFWWFPSVNSIITEKYITARIMIGHAVLLFTVCWQNGAGCSCT